MPSITKPIAAHPSLRRNELGLTVRDYEGSMSTLCAGCGHDSITAALIRAIWELDLAPQNIVKVSGIGCSSKTPAYFVSGGHGFNAAHGRMPPIRAMAIRSPSAWATCATPSGAISACFTSSRIMASTG